MVLPTYEHGIFGSEEMVFKHQEILIKWFTFKLSLFSKFLLWMSFCFPAALKWTIKANSALSKPGNTLAFLGLVEDVVTIWFLTIWQHFSFAKTIEVGKKNQIAENKQSLQNGLTIYC